MPGSPFDAASLLTIVGSAACLAVAAFGKLRLPIRVLLVVIAALVIRIDPARQQSLHIWDESIHAVVGRHAMAHPFVPTLYEQPVVEPSVGDWVEGRIWLHKPPLAMWLMALSMSVAGPSALAMRLPSIVLSASAVFLTFLIGRRLFDERVGLLAAGFHAVNGLLVNLESGRRVGDHVDTLLIVCAQLGAYFVLKDDPRRRPWRFAAAAGLATGAGLLAKSLPALLVPVLAAVQWWPVRRFRGTVAGLTVLLACMLLVAGPWFIYSGLAFAPIARAEALYTISHATTLIEGQGGSATSYIKDMPRYFGELIYIPMAWFLVRALRTPVHHEERTLLAWAATPYIVFSVMATKMPAYVATAAPALFVVQAAFWCQLWTYAVRVSGVRQWLAGTLLVLLAFLPARSLLEKTGPFERRDRAPLLTHQMMDLERDVGRPDAVIFNMPRPREAMFYSPYTVYDRLPRPEELATLQQSGRPFLVFVPTGHSADEFSAWAGHLLFERTR